MENWKSTVGRGKGDISDMQQPRPLILWGEKRHVTLGAVQARLILPGRALQMSDRVYFCSQGPKWKIEVLVVCMHSHARGCSWAEDGPVPEVRLRNCSNSDLPNTKCLTRSGHTLAIRVNLNFDTLYLSTQPSESVAKPIAPKEPFPLVVSYACHDK
jgi:hypothetical protein